MRQNNRFIDRLTPLAADLVGLLLHLVLLPGLVLRLGVRSGRNVILLAGVYTLYCLAVYTLRKLQSVSGTGWQPPAGLLSRRWLTLLAILFGVFMMLAISYLLGFFDALLAPGREALGEIGSSSFFVFGPGAWLGVSLFYVLFLSFPVRPSLKPTTGVRIATAASLLVVNGMLLLATALVKTIFQRAGSGGLLWLLPVLLLFLLLFGPPRLIYQGKRPFTGSLLSFLLLLLFCAWQAVI